MVLGATLEADAGAVAVVAIVAVVLVVVIIRGYRVNTRLGSIESGVEQVNRQVNHVDDPENEPTLRELVVATREQVIATRSDHKALRIDFAAQVEHLAELRKQFQAHLAAHQIEHDETIAAQEGRSERRHP